MRAASHVLVLQLLTIGKYRTIEVNVLFNLIIHSLVITIILLIIIVTIITLITHINISFKNSFLFKCNPATHEHTHVHNDSIIIISMFTPNNEYACAHELVREAASKCECALLAMP